MNIPKERSLTFRDGSKLTSSDLADLIKKRKVAVVDYNPTTQEWDKTPYTEEGK